MFLYNGKYGVVGDDNGLYYMRARYYDISIKRFVNQDVVIGHLDATSSLNRYAYCEGNPVSYLDPFGLDRYDTSELHAWATAIGAVGLIIALIPGLEAPGLAVSVGASCFNAGLYIYDAATSKSWEEASMNILNVFFSLLSAVTGCKAFNAKFFYEANVISQEEYYAWEACDKMIGIGNNDYSSYDDFVEFIGDELKRIMSKLKK